MLLLWKQGISYWKVGLAYALVGVGVGFAGTPASHSLTGSVPVSRAGMASGTADLQRDLGGAIMQSILGAVLTAGYAAAAGAALASGSNACRLSDGGQSELTKSYSSAVDTASRIRRPQQDEIVAAARNRVPPGRRVGVHGRDRRRPPRCGPRLLQVPESATTSGACSPGSPPRTPRAPDGEPCRALELDRLREAGYSLEASATIDRG